MKDRSKGEINPNVALLVLPVCISLGMGIGSLFGTAIKNVSAGVGYGLAGGSAAGLILFGVLYTVLRRKAADEDQTQRK